MGQTNSVIRGSLLAANYLNNKSSGNSQNNSQDIKNEEKKVTPFSKLFFSRTSFKLDNQFKVSQDPIGRVVRIEDVVNDISVSNVTNSEVIYDSSSNVYNNDGNIQENSFVGQSSENPEFIGNTGRIPFGQNSASLFKKVVKEYISPAAFYSVVFGVPIGTLYIAKNALIQTLDIALHHYLTNFLHLCKYLVAPNKAINLITH